MIDEVHGNTYFSEPIAFEIDDGDIKETIRPYAMGRIVDVASFLEDYPCDPDGGELCIDLEIEDDLLPWNDHTFRIRFADGGCTLTDAPAEYHLKMGIGTLSTLLLGYKTAERLFELERIEAGGCRGAAGRCAVPQDPLYFGLYLMRFPEGGAFSPLFFFALVRWARAC